TPSSRAFSRPFAEKAVVISWLGAENCVTRSTVVSDRGLSHCFVFQALTVRTSIDKIAFFCASSYSVRSSAPDKLKELHGFMYEPPLNLLLRKEERCVILFIFF